MMIAVGDTFPSFKALQAAWFTLNHVLSKKYRTLENRPTRCFSANCFSAPVSNWKNVESVCQCHIYARPVKGCNEHLTGEWKIYSFHGIHSCNDNESKRQRYYKSSILDSVSPSLEGYVPSRKKSSGGGQQVRDMAQRSCGLNLKISQSFNVVAAKSQDRVEVHIGQYFFLTSYFQHLKRADPDGTFLFQVQEPQWLIDCQQFRRCYVAFSFAKHAWDIGSIRVITSDGTFTKSGVFNHIVLLAVTHDGNNELVLLAYAICDVENEDNWTWFGEQIAQNFERAKAIVADYDKGIQSCAFQAIVSRMGTKFSRCVRHMIANARDHGVKHKIPDVVTDAVYELAKCRTREAYQKCFLKLRDIDEDVALWFDERKDQFASYLFLEEEKPRYGKQLNNAAEQMNSVIRDPRHQPILDLLVGLSRWIIRKSFERREMSKKWIKLGCRLTEFAQAHHIKCMEFAMQRPVFVTHHECQLE
jgi:hypothetical protein